MKNIKVLLLVFSLTTLQCAHSPNAAPGLKSGAAYQVPSLSKQEALARAQVVSQVEYALEFDFSQPGESYRGKVAIQFKALTGQRDIRVDFAEGKLERVTLNSRPIEPTYNGRYLVLPGNLITKGSHVLEIEFTQKFSNQGRGLVRFVDPQDKQTYLYTDFEPYDANRAFPCFDQPDLKATYELKVLAPKGWQVISSARESSIQPQGPNTAIWNFPRTPRFSTYIFSVIAGPYAKWEDKAFRIPLRLFARQSLAKYVKPTEWFSVTRSGFDFFEEFFGTPYAYKKYDQIMVPEFGAGAMENVAAVTFTERFAVRGEKTKAQERGLAITILHEMAHMWFGDLVTMKWWGDLWLNETFATYMSSLAMSRMAEFPEAWTQFFSGKFGAYWSDQLSTTHPVVATVNDTNDAFTTFDAITYGKGASVLKQLMFTMTEEKFKKGLKLYFDRFAEKNTEYRDFMKVMSEVADLDLDDWQRVWFETAGLNALSASFECQGARISQLLIHQTSPSGAQTLRPHGLKLALMAREGTQVKVSEALRLEISQATTNVTQAIGKPCPHAIFANFEDYDYAKTRLDDRSVNGLKYSINEIDDNLLRYQLWYGLWDKVRDGELSYLAFADLVSPESLAHETNDFILRLLVTNSVNVLSYYELSPLPKSEKEEFANRIDQQVWSRFKRARRGPEQTLWLELMPQVMSSPFGLAKLKSILRGQESVTLDQDRRWDYIVTLARFNDSDASTLIAGEAKRDPTSLGRERQIAALASLPNWDEKMKWINEYKNPQSKFSFSQLRSAIGNLFPYNQKDLRARYGEQYFKDLKAINDSRENFVTSMFAVLNPNECDSATTGMTEKFLKSTDELKPVLKKALQNFIEEGSRCRRIIAVAKDGDRFAPPKPN